MQKFDTPAPLTTVIDLPTAHVQVIAADRTDTTVEIRPADPARNRDTKAAEHIEVEHRDGVLRITAPAISTQQGDITLATATSAALDAGTSHGDITARSL
ncbi:hypothetical protein M2161_008486 [Streptomyces sp. SAI-133]|uniref:hypothetical protein n=1 Tax=Streptomyces sp. SAI-218 TaxID=3377736 RepID=UPI00247CFEC1|nr:hypothetical protein [Streptomyces sp. SAI-133]